MRGLRLRCHRSASSLLRITRKPNTRPCQGPSRSQRIRHCSSLCSCPCMQRSRPCQHPQLAFRHHLCQGNRHLLQDQELAQQHPGGSHL